MLLIWMLQYIANSTQRDSGSLVCTIWDQIHPRSVCPNHLLTLLVGVLWASPISDVIPNFLKVVHELCGCLSTISIEFKVQDLTNWLSLNHVFLLIEFFNHLIFTLQEVYTIVSGVIINKIQNVLYTQGSRRWYRTKEITVYDVKRSWGAIKGRGGGWLFHFPERTRVAGREMWLSGVWSK